MVCYANFTTCLFCFGGPVTKALYARLEPKIGIEMLQLRPSCEWCDKDLPSDSLDACICSYECTFCSDCVENVFSNVCPNCGGGFVSRPIRPKNEYRTGVSVKCQPPSNDRKISKYSLDEIVDFVKSIKAIEPNKR